MSRIRPDDHRAQGASKKQATGRGQDRRTAILDVAVDVFGRVPYDDVSVGKIAEGAGVAHGLVFHYFGNKRKLYIAALERTLADLAEAHRAINSDGDGPRGVVRAIVSAHLDYVESHPETLLGYFRGGIGSDPEARAVIEASRWEGIEQILEVLNLRRPNGMIRMTMRGWVGFLDESTIYWLQHDIRVSRSRIIDMTVQTLVASLIQAGTDQIKGAVDPRMLLTEP